MKKIVNYCQCCVGLEIQQQALTVLVWKLVRLVVTIARKLNSDTPLQTALFSIELHTELQSATVLQIKYR